MKSKQLVFKYWLPVLLIAGFSVALVAWGQKQTPNPPQKNYSDTIPKKKTDKKVKDLDDVIDEMDKIDFEKTMQKAMVELQESMKKLDLSKMQLDMEKAMKEIDMEKLKTDIQKTMKEVDLVKMKAELDASLAKVDWDKMKTELEAVKKIDMKEMEEEMKKLKLEMDKIGPQMKEEMEKAKIEIEKSRGEIEKAKAEIKEYKDFVDQLEKDGLIDKKEYSIKHKNGELFINDKKQPESVYNKYRSFLEKHKTFSMKKDADNFSIDNDDDD